VLNEDYLYRVVDAIDVVAARTGKTVAQIALNWLLQRPTVSNIVVGARNQVQLEENLGALGWSLSPEDIAYLDAASYETPIYPYWNQLLLKERDPKPTGW
jgi:aryl-alcohol dehydrogenase-like predicted oxidoreductase